MNLLRNPIWILLASLSLLQVNALTTFTVDSAVVDDNGSLQTIDNTTPTTYEPAGDSDLVSFTVGGATYDTSTFISGVNIDNAQLSTSTGFIQRAGLGEANDELSGASLQTGSANAASFLAHGQRGLSLSTGINMVASRDPQTTVTFAATIKDANAMLDGTPDFLFGDVADSHSDDIFQMLDASDNVILQTTLLDAGWSDLGSHTIDRVDYSGTAGAPRIVDNNTTRGVALLPFSVDETDLVNTGADWVTEMGLVTQFRLIIPGSGSNPRTDYAFLGVNINIFDVPGAVIPEPTTLPSLLGILAIFVLWARKRLH